MNGEVIERHVGEKDHGLWQGALVRLLSEWRQTANIQVVPERRVRTTADRCRVPDVVVLDRNAPDEQVISYPPLLCVEILCPEDRVVRLEDKIEEYFRMGVRAVWIIDPSRRIGYQCEGPAVREWKASDTPTIPNTPITVEMQAIISDLG